MADCPRCGKKLKVTDLSQYCPHCGINIMYANFEPQFNRDRRIAEMSAANFRTNVEKFRTAYFPGTAQKVRLALSIAPVLGLVIPFGTVAVSSPLHSGSLKLWAVDAVYGAFFGSGLFSKLSSLSDNVVFGACAGAVRTMLLVYFAAAVFAVLTLLDGLLCFIGNKKASISMIVFSVLGALSLGAAAAEAYSVKSVSAALGGTVSAEINLLWTACILLFLLPVIGAVMSLKKPPERKTGPEDALRMEYRRKWRAGEIELLDIPAPIAETEEEKKERRKLVKEAYHMENEGEEAEENG